MKTLEFNELAGDDRVVRLNIPVDAPGERYHVVVHVEPALAAGAKPEEFLSDEFIDSTAGKWVGELTRAPQGDYEQRESL